jgi:uncharacterized alkaline shock family protein YloU
MEGRALISTDVLARYAGDAALEVDGVHALVPSQLHRHRGVRVLEQGSRLEIHVAVVWGANLNAVGEEVERRVSEYLASMANNGVTSVDVVIDEVGTP